MTLAVGDRLPEASFLEVTDGPPVAVPGAEVFAGRAVVFAMPGAFTRTCDGAHLPSVVRSAEALRDEGIDRVVVLAVNDPFVMRAWGEATGATAAGVRMLADADGGFTRAVGMAFDAPPSGFHGRSRRYAMLVEDGVVAHLGVEESRGVCELSAGETMLEAIRAGAGRAA